MSDGTTAGGAFGGERWVRIMCDYSAEGVWAKDGCAASLSDLPISDALRARIMDWQAAYEEADPSDPDGGSLPARHDGEGEAIARAVKSELRDWTVVYFNEALCHETGPHEWPLTADQRRAFEYEIR